MKCPECGAWTRVKETRGTKRRRVCANETHVFTTEETVVSSTPLISDDCKQRIAEMLAERVSLRKISAAVGVSVTTVMRVSKRLNSTAGT